MPEVGRGPLVVVVGIDGHPTDAFVSDVARLHYSPKLVAWPTAKLDAGQERPVATVVDFRALGVHAEQACIAVQRHRNLRRGPIIALVLEQEGPRLDMSLGFDDLILAPYRLGELAARLRLARWRVESAADPGVIRVGPIALSPATYEVFVHRSPVELTLKEYQLLLFLMQHPGRVFPRADLLDHVWGSDYFGGTRTVDVHIRRIRAKTESAGDLIETVRGVGYRLVPPPAEDG
jgi:DNA-binding response OmpR family regulator